MFFIAVPHGLGGLFVCVQRVWVSECARSKDNERTESKNVNYKSFTEQN
jgi:hypothetical protein